MSTGTPGVPTAADFAKIRRPSQSPPDHSSLKSPSAGTVGKLKFKQASQAPAAKSAAKGITRASIAKIKFKPASQAPAIKTKS
jgi:hypothetical protein